MEKEPLEHISDIQPDPMAHEILRTLLARFIIFGSESISLQIIADGSGCTKSEIEDRFGSLAGCYDALYDASWHEINEALKEHELTRPFPSSQAEDSLIADVELILDTYLAKNTSASWALQFILLTLHNPRNLSNHHFASETQAIFEDRLFTQCEDIMVNTPGLLARGLSVGAVGVKVFEIVRNTAATWLSFGPDSIPKEEVLELIRLYLRGEAIE